ncbi:NAD(P)-binding domain-containing protein [Arthrobacter sp. NPDC058192]|uniref:NAD(P)-binding domain-containing protein n=1 Tax=Arthrobacter sp. NPDC058192 TaxID=3346372 RepID=UPI0036E7CF18
MREQQDIVVIGGGQAGLAMSRVLQRQGREHVVLERGRVGERWRTERWDSLRFQFPNWTVQLPDYTYQGPDPEGFARYREILRFLEDYAGHAAAPVREHTEVRGLTALAGDEGFELSLADASIHARNVVLATGPFQLPRIPDLAHQVPRSVMQLDPTRYRSPETLPEAYAGFLAAARDFIQRSGEDEPTEADPGEPEPLPGVQEVESLNLVDEGITTIIWATGYTYDYGWVRIPVFDARGRPAQQHGVTAVPGLYFLALHWMHTFKSGLLSGVGDDAEFLVDRMSRGRQE